MHRPAARPAAGGVNRHTRSRLQAGPGASGCPGLPPIPPRRIAMPTEWPLTELIRLAGLGQVVLVAGSLAVPRVLGWRRELAGLRPLTRQVFWTYAGYILTTNLVFGLVSALA